MFFSVNIFIGTADDLAKKLLLFENKICCYFLLSPYGKQYLDIRILCSLNIRKEISSKNYDSPKYYTRMKTKTFSYVLH